MSWNGGTSASGEARSTAVRCSVVAGLMMLLSGATGCSAETRLGDRKPPPGFRIAPYDEVSNARSMAPGERGAPFVDKAGMVYRISTD